jgi:hypothetical protein
MTAGAGWMGEINNETPVTHVSLPSVTDGVVMPQISFDGQHAPTQWGSSGSLLASINRKLAVTFVNNWMWSKGRQTFNFGWDAGCVAVRLWRWPIFIQSQLNLYPAAWRREQRSDLFEFRQFLRQLHARARR